MFSGGSIRDIGKKKVNLTYYYSLIIMSFLISCATNKYKELFKTTKTFYVKVTMKTVQPINKVYKDLLFYASFF